MKKTILVLGSALIIALLLVIGCGKDPVSNQADLNNSALSAPSDDSVASGSLIPPNNLGAGTLTPFTVNAIEINGVRTELILSTPAFRARIGDRVTIYGTALVSGQADAVYAIDGLGLVCARIPLTPASGLQTVTYTTTVGGSGILHIRFSYLGRMTMLVFFAEGQPWGNTNVKPYGSAIEETFTQAGYPGRVTDVAVADQQGSYFSTYGFPRPPSMIQVELPSQVNETNCDAIIYAAEYEAGGMVWQDKGATISDPSLVYSFPYLAVEEAYKVCHEKHAHSKDFVEQLGQYTESSSQDVIHVGIYVFSGVACLAQPELVVPCAFFVELVKADVAAALIQASAKTVINAHYQDIGMTAQERDLAVQGVSLVSFTPGKRRFPNPWDARLSETSARLLFANKVRDRIGTMKKIGTGVNILNVVKTGNSLSGDVEGEDVNITIYWKTPLANQPPTVTLSCPSTGQAGSKVTISVTSYDPEGAPVSITLNWGDGSPDQTITGQSAHIYPTGTFTIKAIGFNGSVMSPTVTCVVTITPPVNTPPTACWTYTPLAVTTATPIVVNAGCSSDRETALSALLVRWQIDGVWTAWTTTKTLSKQWTTAGSKTVILEVKDAAGATAQQAKTIQVTTAPVPRVYITICPGSGTTGIPVSATVTAENAQRICASWGGQSAYEYFTFTGQPIQIIHTYPSAGSNYLNVWAYSNGVWSAGVACLIKITAPVVNTPPTACWTYSPLAVTTATTVSLNAGCSTDLETAFSALLVRWQIDGVWTAWTTTKTLAKQWTTAGSKTVILEVKDQGGLTAQTSKTVTVSNAWTPMVILTTSIPGGNLQANYSVDLTKSGGTSGYGVSWSIDVTPPGLTFRNNSDGTATLSGIPSAAGSYPFTVTVRDAGTPSNTASRTFTLVVGPALNNPPALIVPSTGTGQLNATTTISYTVSDRETALSGLCVAVDWLDGTLDYFWGGIPAIHIYRSVGPYGARFTAWDGTNWSATSTCYITITNSCSNMPTLLGPINGQTVSLSAGFSFSWTKVCESVGEYNLYVLTAPNSSGTTVFADRISPTWTSLRYWGTGLQPNTTYYWCLQMGNYSGAPLTPFATFRTAP